MKAISFFSYKGGVGRTMALTNMAMRLVEFGKSVMILDFDLEAPGVPFKMKRYVTNDQVKSGIVDYIHEFSKLGRIADIKDYVMTLPKNNLGDENMWFLPAGNSNADDYWQKLSSISWSDMFYKEGGGGLRFFLDLKEKIKKEYNPDFLLIDSRTGITELSGISLKILADEIVVLFVNNEENIYGTERVMQFLNKKDETDKANAPTTHLVLTRINKSKKEKPLDYKKEYDLINKIKKRLVNGEDAKNLDISVVHTDERLQHNEQLGFAHSHNENSVGIFEEHILLFDKIFKKFFSVKDWEKQNNAKEAELLFHRLDKKNYSEDSILVLNRIIELDNDKWEYYLQRGLIYYQMQRSSEAIIEYNKAIELNKNLSVIYSLLSLSYFRMGDFKKSYEVAQTALEKEPPDKLFLTLTKISCLEALGENVEALNLINKTIIDFPENANVYNSRANIYRKMRDFANAKRDIIKAISLKQDAVFYGTLAEIYSDSGNDDEFYLNITTALNLGIEVSGMRSAKDAYMRYRREPRFIELLRSYSLDSEDIFHDGIITDKYDSRIESEDVDSESGFLDL